jgi:hypothetical protein
VVVVTVVEAGIELEETDKGLKGLLGEKTRIGGGEDVPPKAAKW